MFFASKLNKSGNNKEFSIKKLSIGIVSVCMIICCNLLIVNPIQVQANEPTTILESLEKSSVNGKQENQTFSIFDSNSFRTALTNSKDGDILYFTQSFQEINEDPIIINKQVILEGNNQTITTRAPRILLNNDVIIKNLTIGLQQNMHSGIFVNGYSLTLENVSSANEIATPLNIYGGAYNSTITDNREATILLKGSKVINGSIYSGGYGQQSSPGKTTIVLGEDITSKMDTIYASGVDFSNYDPNDWFSHLGISSGSNIYHPLQDSNNVKTIVQLHNTKNIYNAIEGNGVTELQLFDNKYGFFDLRSSNLDKISILKGKYSPLNPEVIKNVSFYLAKDTLLDLTRSSAFEDTVIRELESDNGKISMLNYGTLILDSIENKSKVLVSTNNSINEDYFKIVIKSGGQKNQFILEDKDYQLKYNKDNNTFTAVDIFSIEVENTEAEATEEISQTADLASASTPVTVDLTTPNTPTPKPPSDPTDPDITGNKPSDGGVTGESGNLGIAYYPKAFAFTGKLGTDTLNLTDSGSNFSGGNVTYNIGAKDNTRQNNSWTLTAQLQWSNSELPGSEITVTNPDQGKVKLNQNDGISNFQNDVQGTDSNTVVISNSPTTIMKKGKVTVGKGTYDYSLGNVGTLKLMILNATDLVAKQYSGNVNWNLQISPDTSSSSVD
ncbi:YSIRK-type signal peptide-containing protein [Enterococcus hirae]|nr:YSIRK-type signal peptide-containing protein [Enterococcus hirae]